MMVFTLGNGSATGKYILKSNNYNNSIADHYLTFGSSTSVNMTTEPSDLLLNYKTQSSADVAIQDAAGDRMLKGSNATPVVFGYYSATSGYHNVQLYKEVDSREACAMPTVTITPDAVVEGNEAKVTITAEAGASVRYTTDGTIPTATKGTEYTVHRRVYAYKPYRQYHRQGHRIRRGQEELGSGRGYRHCYVEAAYAEGDLER